MSPDRHEELMSHLYAAAFGEAPPPEGEGVARMLLEVAELVCESGEHGIAAARFARGAAPCFSG